MKKRWTNEALDRQFQGPQGGPRGSIAGLAVLAALALPSELLAQGLTVAPADSPPGGPIGAQAVVWVDDGYDQDTPGWGSWRFAAIQDGVDAVQPGGTVNVAAGLYQEHVLVSKTLRLLGESRYAVSLEGNGSGDILTIAADEVEVRGMFIAYAGMHTGVKIQSAQDCVVTDTSIGACLYGVWLDDSSGNQIGDPKGAKPVMVGSHRDGANMIIAYDYCGVLLSDSSQNVIARNVIASGPMGGYGGIVFVGTSDDNEVLQNLIALNSVGLETSTSGGRFVRNRFWLNFEFGIDCDGSGNLFERNTLEQNGLGASLSGAGNTVRFNIFQGNTQSAEELGSNTWDDDYPHGGNLWGDHVDAYDENGDNILDTPYDIPGGAQDRYPLAGPRPKGWAYVSPVYDSSTPGWGVDHFDTVQAGVDAVEPGETVVVCNGEYHESVLVAEPIHLVGESRYGAILHGDWSATPLTLLADGTQVWTLGVAAGEPEGISVQGAVDVAITNCTVRSCGTGIGLMGAVAASLVGNDLELNGMQGVLADSAQQCILSSNNVRWNYEGLVLANSDDCSIVGNTVEGNDHGVMLYGCGAVHITGNTFAGNMLEGVSLLGAVGNLVVENLFDQNYGYGVLADAQSFDNSIHHNVFASAFSTYFAWDEGANVWDNGAYGNQWEDYPGLDLDCDGVGDSPYAIPGGPNLDRFPVVPDPDCSPPPAADVYVDDDFDASTPGWGHDHFDTIQAGVDAVEPDGTVFVFSGEGQAYEENVIVTKTLDLLGEDRDTTVIDGRHLTNTLRIHANDVSVSGFTVQSSSWGWGAAIYLYGNYCTISDCILQDSNDGLWMNNKSHNTVTGCYFRWNSSGMDMLKSHHNLFTWNVFEQNSYGLELRDGSSNNQSYENDFLFNSVSALDYGANAWDNGTRGNYWSDHDPGDEEYVIYKYGVDHCPLAQPH